MRTQTIIVKVVYTTYNAGEVCASRRLFCFFRLHLEEHRVCTGVCEVMIERYLAFKKLGFLERQSTVSSFSFQVLFQTSDNPTWVSRIQTQTRRIALRTVTETPEVYAVCTVGGDDVCTLTIQETRLSWRSAVAYFSSKVLSNTSIAPHWV